MAHGKTSDWEGRNGVDDGNNEIMLITVVKITMQMNDDDDDDFKDSTF